VPLLLQSCASDLKCRTTAVVQPAAVHQSRNNRLSTAIMTQCAMPAGLVKGPSALAHWASPGRAPCTPRHDDSVSDHDPAHAIRCCCCIGHRVCRQVLDRWDGRSLRYQVLAPLEVSLLFALFPRRKACHACCSLFQAALLAHRRTASAVRLLQNSFEVSETGLKLADETSGWPVDNTAVQ
jgi:hypothetical protein